MANLVFPPLRSEALIDPRTGEITIRYAEYFQQVSSTVFTDSEESNERFEVIEDRLDGIDDRLDGIDIRLNAIDVRIDDQDTRLDEQDIIIQDAFQLISQINI